MKIIKKGSFIILTPEEELKSQFLSIEEAGRTCYRSEGKEITEEWIFHLTGGTRI